MSNATETEETVDGLRLREATAEQVRQKLGENLRRAWRYSEGNEEARAHARKRVIQFADELERRAPRSGAPSLDELPEGAGVWEMEEAHEAARALVDAGDCVLVERDAVRILIAEHSASDGRPLSFRVTEDPDGRPLYLVRVEAA